LFKNGRLLQKRGLFVSIFIITAWNSGDIREVCSRIKGGVYVNEVHLPREFRQERRQHILLISPDQSIAPLWLPTRREQVQAPLTILYALVDRLDGLKRERNLHRGLLLATFVLPIPYEFCHADRRS